MKKTITLVVLLAGAASGYSQGQVNFYNFTGGFKQKIYNVSSAASTVVAYGGYTTTEEVGSAAAQTPAGTTVYSGAGLLGVGFSAELLAAAGSGDTLSQLSPVGLPVTFTTSTSGAGYFGAAEAVTLPTTGVATIAIAAWNNGGGLYDTLALAQAAGEPWGISPLSSITGVVAPGTPGSMSTASDLNLSFSLGSVPEPSTIALGVMGASTLLFRRRK